MGLSSRIKGYFLRGLAVLLPAVLTVWILAAGYMFLQEHVTIHINRGLVWLIERVQGDAAPSHEDLEAIFVEGPAGSALGFMLVIILVCLIGALLASVLGRGLLHMIETFILNTPILNKIYPYVKQVTDFVLARQEEHQQLFSRVVAVEYPRPGIWSLGLVTGEGIQAVADKTGQDMLTVLIPNSPTPVTGYVIVVPRELTIPLNLTIEQAFRFTISAGVITPGDGDSQANPEGREAMAKMS
jgi:uncharacterized membrane protein